MPRCTLPLTSLLLFAVGLASAADDNPKFYGKPLGEWMDMLRQDKEAKRRRAALIVLDAAGPSQRGVLSAVVGAAQKDETEEVRTDAVKLLGRLVVRARDTKVETSEAIAALASALRSDRAAKVREAAAASLGRIGPEAIAGVPALTDALKDKDEGTRASSAEALGLIGSFARSAQPALLTALADKTLGPATRRNAAYAIGQVGGDNPAASAVALAAALGDTTAPAEVRRASAESLGRLGRDATSGVPTLATALKDKDAELRRAAVGVLDRLGADARPALAALKEAARDEDRAVRSVAVHALGLLGKGAADGVLPTLLEALKDKHVEVRIAAVVALGSLGAEGKSAAPALENLKRDGVQAVREAAREALAKIEGTAEKS